eukprot:6243737-Prymnesium_polylepis.2
MTLTPIPINAWASAAHRLASVWESNLARVSLGESTSTLEIRPNVASASERGGPSMRCSIPCERMSTFPSRDDGRCGISLICMTVVPSGEAYRSAMTPSAALITPSSAASRGRCGMLHQSQKRAAPSGSSRDDARRRRKRLSAAMRCPYGSGAARTLRSPRSRSRAAASKGTSAPGTRASSCIRGGHQLSSCRSRKSTLMSLIVPPRSAVATRSSSFLSIAFPTDGSTGSVEQGTQKQAGAQQRRTISGSL